MGVNVLKRHGFSAVLGIKRVSDLKRAAHLQPPCLRVPRIESIESKKIFSDFIPFSFEKIKSSLVFHFNHLKYFICVTLMM